jgi:hypothetical protein
MNEDLTLAEYIVWINYGEGWSPSCFDTWEEVLREIGGSLIGEWIITRPVRIPEPPKED